MVARRLFVALACTAVLAAPAANPAAAQEKTHTLKVAIFTPEPGSSSRWFKIKKEEVAKKSNGRLNIELFFGASMGPLPRHYDLTRTGVSDMSWFQHGATPGRFPLTELLHIPFMFPAGAKGAVVGAKVAGDLLPDLRKEHDGTELLWIVNNRPSGIYDTGKPIRTLDDLRGRRYRTPTSADAAILKEVGGVPVGVPATEMAEQLQKGTINGAVTDPMGIYTFKLGNLVKYYSDTVRSAITFGTVINPKSRAALPEDLRKLIDGLGGKANGVLMAELTWNDFPHFTDYMKESNIETVRLSADADKRLRAASERFAKEKVDELEKKGLPAKKFYERAKALSAKYEKES
jgi:TRAP-type C4-dicarboxylate transport system substrate-binding protein